MFSDTQTYIFLTCVFLSFDENVQSIIIKIASILLIIINKNKKVTNSEDSAGNGKGLENITRTEKFVFV